MDAGTSGTWSCSPPRDERRPAGEGVLDKTRPARGVVALAPLILAMPMFTGPKPFVVVDLLGTGGNIFAIIGRCERLATVAGKPEHEINAFRRAVTSTHSYADALATVEAWFDAIIVGWEP